MTTRSRIRWAALCTALALGSCGGGGTDGGSGLTTNASPGGIWRGTDSVTGLGILGLADEAGDFHFIRSDGVQFVGTAATTGNTLSADFEGYTAFGTAFPDASTHGTGTLSGTVQARSAIQGTVHFTTDAGNASNGTLALTYDNLYDRPSSLATVGGNYIDTASGTVVSVSGSGTLFAQDATTGCVLNGSVSIIDASYNAYRVQFDYGNCLGAAAALNGITFSGLATLDNTVTPERAIVGVTGQSGATKYALVLVLNRT